jgi:transposase-like protein
VAILRLHLLEQKPVSDLCDPFGIQPNLFYRWQREFFENGATAFTANGKGHQTIEAAGSFRPFLRGWPEGFLPTTGGAGSYKLASL